MKQDENASFRKLTTEQALANFEADDWRPDFHKDVTPAAVGQREQTKTDIVDAMRHAIYDQIADPDKMIEQSKTEALLEKQLRKALEKQLLKVGKKVWKPEQKSLF